jgi:hypothetical protein
MALDWPRLVLGGKISMILGASAPSILLKEKHNVIAYHCIREAISAKALRFACIKSKETSAT